MAIDKKRNCQRSQFRSKICIPVGQFQVTFENLFGSGSNFDGRVDWVGAFATAGNGNAGQLGNGDQGDFGIQIDTKFMFLKKKYKEKF